jgi:hypothetical protein
VEKYVTHRQLKENLYISETIIDRGNPFAYLRKLLAQSIQRKNASKLNEK